MFTAVAVDGSAGLAVVARLEGEGVVGPSLELSFEAYNLMTGFLVTASAPFATPLNTTEACTSLRGTARVGNRGVCDCV